MGLLQTCPSCGLKSDQIRCPRCNALKVVGCDGQCAACRMAAPVDSTCGSPAVESEATSRSGAKEPA
jgi:hypothetical protein